MSANENLERLAFVGCYTSETCHDGLHVVACETRTGALRLVASHPIENAIYQAVTPDGGHLLSCREGGLAAYRIDGARLEPTDGLDLGGPCLCHVAAMPDGERVLWADYKAPAAGSVLFRAGRFVPASLVRHVHSGSGPNVPRQATAHCHQAVPLPEGDGYAVVDLGQDRVFTYPSGASAATVPPGAGPRHLVFSPDGRFVLVVSEMGNVVTSYRRVSATRLDPVSQLSTLPDGWRGTSATAAIRLSPDGTRVFVTNRGHDSVAGYDFDAERGTLRQVGWTALPGAGPRDFDFIPGSDLALAALEGAGKVVSLRYRASSGDFEVLAELDGLYRPCALSFPRSRRMLS